MDIINQLGGLMADRPTFNWLMKPMNGNESVQVLVNTLRSEFLEAFDQVYADVNSILCIHSGFKLVFSQENGENQIHPGNYEGAGEVTPEDGHLPILFFAALHKVMREEAPSIAGMLTFCTEEGEPIRLESWPELKAEYTRLGVYESDAFECIRSDAEAIGFVDPVYRLDKLGDDEPAMFF
ncbi:MAG: hypothetical protein AB2669_07965 [Candidatus Thiodiazotropha endolucinida]|nr:hypothetical protein [Candidatus Thiodiazotropha taylori]MCW4249658.1 hypothetical protein [Candidatus Thiodiazotropha endolucinida]MCG7883046.1 hypothetical protein [Candidatus Thiodiazotropha taylori]MCG8058688.1 hypothetical protein [Candidatus Thiodiazotropha taylori]MCG8104626.1 hypothetical protein [Candidatus Thiodiazotropha taylori]